MPLFLVNWLGDYPAEAHARFMVPGFGGCFITGFLGTAGPRLLGAPPWRKWELAVHAALPLAMMASLAANRISQADLFAGIWLLGVFASMMFRLVRERTDLPPPGMPAAGLGVAAAGLAAIALGLSTAGNYPPECYHFLRLLYFQGLLWLPVIAVAPFLLPRFFGRKSGHEFEDSSEIPPGWLAPFAESAGAALAIVASFAWEAWGGPRAGPALRAIVIFAYFSRAVPGLVSWSRTNGLGWALRWVPVCAAAGWVLDSAFPVYRVGMLHLMFIGGAGLLILVVAARVFLGHGGRNDRLGSPLRWFHAVWALAIFTAATRVVAEFLPRLRFSHFIYAAVLWIAMVAFWAWKLRRESKLPVFAESAIQRTRPGGK